MIPVIPVKAYLIGGACFLSFISGWGINNWRWEAKQASALQEQIDARQKAEQDAVKLSHDFEQERERNRVTIKKVERNLNRERQSNAAYACPVPDYGVQLYNQPRVMAHPSGEPHATLPTP